MLVTATDLTRRYGQGEATVHALAGVSVDFPAGQFTAIMGPSGSGKSTLMHLLAGLDRPTSGSVVLDGTELSKLDDKKRAQALTLHAEKSNTIDDICRTLRVGRSTLYRYLAEGKRQ